MGRLIYSDTLPPLDIDDRVLAHVRLVVMTKLRRGEPFTLTLPSPEGGTGPRALWISPSMPLVLHFYGSRPAAIDRELVERMLAQASGAEGLHLGRI